MNAEIAQTQPQKPRFRFSGHDTFPCRYTWLPKAVQHLRRNNDLFADEDDAMVQLGVGKTWSAPSASGQTLHISPSRTSHRLPAFAPHSLVRTSLALRALTN